MIFSAIILALFVSAYITKRRFGLLGLALAAGSLLASIWGYNAELVVNGLGFASSPMTSAVVASFITLLPSCMLLFHGYTYKTIFGRTIGAAMFTLLAVAFLVEPLGHILMPQGIGSNVYQWLVDNKSFIVGTGMVVAVVDLFLTKPAHLADKRRKH